MTLCIAWERDSENGKQLVLATDSLITGGLSYPHGSKLVAFQQKACGLCWEGSTTFTYSFAENARVDVEYADGLNNTDVPIVAVARRITKVFNQLWQANLADKESCFHNDEFSFLFGGFCPKYKETNVYHIRRKESKFTCERRDPQSWRPHLTGSGAEYARSLKISNPDLSPYDCLVATIEAREINHVGGIPQLITFDRTGATVVGVIKDKKRYLFGRDLDSSGHVSRVLYVNYSDNEFQHDPGRNPKKVQ